MGVALLREKGELTESLAQKLLKDETLDHDDIVGILGERPFQNDQYKDYLTNTEEFLTRYGEEEEKAHEVPAAEIEPTESDSGNETSEVGGEPSESNDETKSESETSNDGKT